MTPKKFRLYLVTNEPTRKVWHQLGMGNHLKIYTAIETNGLWSLYVKISGYRYEFEHGQLLYHNTMQNVLAYIGASTPSKAGEQR